MDGGRRFGLALRGAFVALACAACVVLGHCGGSKPGNGIPATAGAGGPVGPDGDAIPYIFVVAMENQDADRIYGNFDDAPYINGTLIPRYAHATAFADPLPKAPSEPHYLWLEAGTNAFADHTFTTNDNPSATNSTASRDHLTAQIAAAADAAIDWMSYQEGINGTTGRCPIASDGLYRPRHNPFVFFRDVIGDPPSKDTADCAAHHRDLGGLAADLTSGDVAAYNFVTPNLCHDMHGDSACSTTNRIRGGDDWLSQNVPALITFVDAKGGIIFIVWEEGADTTTLPFVAVGPDVKPGYAGGVSYTHTSLLKTVEELLGLPILPAVAGANDLADLFAP